VRAGTGRRTAGVADQPSPCALSRSKYLEALGAGTLAIGLFGTAQDFLEAVYQYPDGWLADHLGRRRALMIFIVLSGFGYLLYLLSPSWQFVFIGRAFSMAR
jgi:MFS family permease